MKKSYLIFLLFTTFIYSNVQNYYHLEGNLGINSVSMDINIYSDNNVDIMYSYDKFAEPIHLTGEFKKDKIVAKNDNEEFNGTLKNGVYFGSWVGKKSLDFSLKETYKTSATIEELKMTNMYPLILSSAKSNYINTTSIIYNKANLLVSEELNYYYSGGAHGNWSKMYKTYDKDSKKLITYYDFFDYDAMDVLKGIILKKVEEKKVNSFKEEFYVTDNVYFTDKGISFNYNPYEIAPYSEGDIHIFVAYSEIPKKLFLLNDITSKIIK